MLSQESLDELPYWFRSGILALRDNPPLFYGPDASEQWKAYQKGREDVVRLLVRFHKYCGEGCQSGTT